jgi:hypothetical protein
MRLRVVSGDQPVQLEATNGEAEMIALADCLAMCGLSEDEVLAIAEHEHIPEIAAAALADGPSLELFRHRAKRLTVGLGRADPP